jgi:hypothetical protein
LGKNGELMDTSNLDISFTQQVNEVLARLLPGD